MIDTLNFTLPNAYFDYKHVNQVFNDKLTYKVDKRYINGTALIANYKNYNFSLSEKYLKATGSLTKLYKNNNVENLKYCEVRNALTLFETLFEISFDDAIVNRIDIAASLVMNNPVEMFLELMIPPNNYKLRLYGNETKGFEGSDNSLNFYNKVPQTRKNDTVSYQKYKGQYILRYEIKLFKNLMGLLELPDLKLKNFFDPAVYKTLINRWYEGYKSVPMLTNTNSFQLDANTVKKFNDLIYDSGIKYWGGINSVIHMVNQMQLKKNVKFQIKKRLNRCIDMEPLNPMLKFELDNKIDSIYYDAMDEIKSYADTPAFPAV